MYEKLSNNVPKKGRHELKQLLTAPQYHILRGRAEALLEPDANMSSPDGYLISSLYLDDADESAYYEKLDGAPQRKKYRFRYYNRDPSFIALECKEKRGDRIFKRSERVDRLCFEAFASGDASALDGLPSPVCREVSSLARERLLSPRVVVSYTRQAYQHPLSKTRVTFDTALIAGGPRSGFFDSENADSRYALPCFILEIKYDDFLPSFVADLLRCRSTRLAVSKYVLCRDCLKNIFTEKNL